MINIKKTIDIILISAAIAAVVIFADRIIPSRSLSAEQSIKDVNTGEVLESDASTEGSGMEVKTDMVIDDSLFMPEKDIFTASAPEAAEGEDKIVTVKNDSGPGSITQEVAGESQGTEGPAEEAADVNIEEGSEETAENSEDVTGLEDNIDYSKSEDFRIEVDLERQRVIVFYNDNVLKEMVCSGGAAESPTPLGEYVTSQKIEYAWIDRFGVGAYYWTRFFEDYLIHSVPFDENGEMIIEEYEKLGSPASHGCIRLRVEEAKWLYETLPLGVKVLIY